MKLDTNLEIPCSREENKLDVETSTAGPILCDNWMGFLLEPLSDNIPCLVNLSNALNESNVISYKHLMFNTIGLREGTGTVFPKVDSNAGECAPRTESMAKKSLFK